MMSVSTAEVLRPDLALRALVWAADVASVDPTLAEKRPQSPTGEEWNTLSVAVVRHELDRLLTGRQPDMGLDALLQIGFLHAWLPEIEALVGFGDGEWRH